MKRRLNYLFPDAPHARNLNPELSELVIPRLSVQALAASRAELGKAVPTHLGSDRDRDNLLEWWLWRANLAVFCLALFASIGMLVFALTSYLVLPLLLMAACLVAGILFSLRMPNVHWREFNQAIHHGEILLMVDVPPANLKLVDQYSHRQHPEAVTGGVGWVA